MIRGIADSPCYLALAPGGKATLEDASELWGKDTLETEGMLRKKYPGCQVACIGPAGENLVGYAKGYWGRFYLFSFFRSTSTMFLGRPAFLDHAHLVL